MRFHQFNGAENRQHRKMKSPSKFLSSEYLRAVQRNGGKSDSGQEYAPDEVDALLSRKEDMAAEDMLRRLDQQYARWADEEEQEGVDVESKQVKGSGKNPKVGGSVVVDFASKRAERDGVKCGADMGRGKACEFVAKSDDDWSVGVGVYSGVHVCPECGTTRDTLILPPGAVSEGPEHVFAMIPKSFLLKLHRQYDEKSGFNVGNMVLNGWREMLFELVKGQESVLLPED